MGIQSHPAPKKGKEDHPQKKKFNFFLKENPTTQSHSTHSPSALKLRSHELPHSENTKHLSQFAESLFAFCLYVCLSVFRRRTRAAEESLSAFLRFNSSHLRRGGFTTSQSLFCCCASASSSRRRLWGLCTLDFWNGGRLLLRM
jgi:hypothetical protein